MVQGLSVSIVSPVNVAAVPQLPAFPTMQLLTAQSIVSEFWKKTFQPWFGEVADG